MAASKVLARLNGFFWEELPTVVSRNSATWGALLADGFQLSAWPLIGALLPPFAGLLGLLLGWLHWGFDPADQIVFLYSLPAVLAFVVLGLQGVGTGVWLWLGFSLGDMLWTAFARHPTATSEMVLAGRALQDLLLAGGLIGVPAAVAGLSQRLAGREGADEASPLEGLLRAGLGFTLVYLWLLSTAVQLQAVYNFEGIGARTHGLVAGLGHWAWAIALVGACAAAARGMAERAALRLGAYEERLASLRRTLLAAQSANPARTGAAIVAKAGLATFALSAFISNWTEGLILAAAIMLILAVRAFGLGAFGLGAQIAKILSLRIRLSAAVAIVCAVSWFLLRRSWASGNSFTPALSAVMISLMVFAVLLPEGAARAGAWKGAKPASAKGAP
jgi:hypothetical protein